MTKLRIIHSDCRHNVYRGNRLVAYLEDGILYRIVDGYAEEIGECDHLTKITGMLSAAR